jgi:Ecdysteroid kinase-like family
VKIPVHPDGVTAEWLTDTLRATGTLTHARVTTLETQLLGSEKGMTGQLARLGLAYDRDEVAAPRSLIAKFSAADPQARAVIHGMGFYEREVRFYEQLAGQSPLRTPRCYFSALDPAQGVALLLLEDLAAARNGSWIAGCSVAEAELAIRAIASFHAVWWQHPQLEEQHWLELRSLVSVQQAPVIFQQAWEPFLGKLGTHVTDDILQIGAWLRMYLGRLCAYLYQEAPCTLIHNDYQADNLFFVGAGPTPALAVADWQLTTRGRAVLDVAWFLGGNLDSSARQEHELRLLRTYHMLLIDNGVRDYPFEQCWDDYRLAMVHPISRIITVVGIGGAPSEQERGYCNVLVPRYCRAAHDLKVGEILNAAFADHGQ